MKESDRAWPVKRVPSSVGRKLFTFVRDEKANFQNAIYDLAEEMHFFDSLADAMDRWINRPEDLVAEEQLFYGMSGFARAQLFQGAANYMRGHYASGLISGRLALEAALYAEAIAAGLMTEEEYLTDDRKRTGLTRHLRNLERESRLPNTRFGVLLKSIELLSASGAHAEVQVWGSWLANKESGWFVSFFQRPKEIDRLAYDFLGICWFIGLAFKSFLHLAEERFNSTTAGSYLVELTSWQDAMEMNKSKFKV